MEHQLRADGHGTADDTVNGRKDVPSGQGDNITVANITPQATVPSEKVRYSGGVRKDDAAISGSTTAVKSSVHSAQHTTPEINLPLDDPTMRVSDSRKKAPHKVLGF